MERLRNLWKNSAVKYTFLTLMLLAKFTPEVKAGTTTDKPGDLQGQTKTEFNQKEVADNKENSLVYQVEPEDFKVESDLGDDPSIDSKKLPFEPVSKWLEFESNDSAFKSYAQFELSNYYLTDLADISPEYQQKISQQFSDFLAQINPDNFDQVMAHAWEISGSSDKRPTKNWGGSNEELTKARINVAKNTLNSVIENYDFSSSGLTVEQIKYLQEKSIISKVYESGSGSEKGVKYITDLINPQTGDFYTPEEAGKLKGTALDAALQECRQISFNGLSLKLETLQKIPILTPELKEDKSIELRKTLTNWDQFEHVILAVDNSPSMTAAYQHMAEVISRQSELQKTKLKFGTFSDRLGKLSSSKVTEVTKFIAEMKKDGSPHERALHSTLEALRELPKAKTNEKNLIVVATDEPLQAINQELIDQLMSEAEAKNCQITFVYAHAREGKIARAISLEEVAVEYSKILWERLAPQIKYTLENEEARIKNLESTLKDIQQEINKLLDRDKLSKEQRKSLVQFQARKDIFEQQLDYSQLLKNELSKALASNDSAVLYEASKLTRRLNLKQISHISINPSGLGVDIALD